MEYQLAWLLEYCVLGRGAGPGRFSLVSSQQCQSVSQSNWPTTWLVSSTSAGSSSCFSRLLLVR